MCQNSFRNPPNRPNISSHFKSTLSLNPNLLLLSCAGLCFEVKSLFNGMDMGNTDGSTKTEIPRLARAEVIWVCWDDVTSGVVGKRPQVFDFPCFLFASRLNQTGRIVPPPPPLPHLYLEETSSCSSVGTACLHLSSKEITQPGLDSPTDKAKSSVEPRLKSFRYK